EVDGRDNRSEQVLELTREQTRELVAAHSAEETADLLTAVRSDAAARILGRLDPETAAEALSPLSLSIASWILRAMDERSEPILEAIEPQRRDGLLQLLHYPAESIGANMTPSILSLPATASAHQAVDIVRGTGPTTESARYVHLTGPDGELGGVPTLRDLAGDDVTVVQADADQETLISVFTENSFASIPVVDRGRLVGVVTGEQVADVQAAETTEDFRRMGAAGGLTMSLRDAGIWAL